MSFLANCDAIKISTFVIALLSFGGVLYNIFLSHRNRNIQYLFDSIKRTDSLQQVVKWITFIRYKDDIQYKDCFTKSLHRDRLNKNNIESEPDKPNETEVIQLLYIFVDIAHLYKLKICSKKDIKDVIGIFIISTIDILLAEERFKKITCTLLNSNEFSALMKLINLKSFIALSHTLNLKNITKIRNAK
jgi:hypothetical protein